MNKVVILLKMTWSYILNILAPNNLPSWLTLGTIVFVYYTYQQQIETSINEKNKIELVKEITNTHGPIAHSVIEKNKSKIRAASSLLRDGILLRTAGGYELNRYLPRLNSDIKFAALIERKSFFDTLNKKQDNQKCDLLESTIINMKNTVRRLEKMRDENVDGKFKFYLAKHTDIYFMSLMSASNNKVNSSAGELLDKCYP